MVSNWWTAVGGVQIDLRHDAVLLDDKVLLDDSGGNWRGLYAGSSVAVIAVAAVERVYGPQALGEHPGLQQLLDGDIGLRPDRIATAANTDRHTRRGP
jgi:hypothetical protein